MANNSKLSISETNFNVKDIHISRIKNYLKNHGTVIIHGDGMMFVGAEAEKGSEHHKEFNSGYELNKAEVVSLAKFRAIYKTGDTLPTTPDDVLSEFYANSQREIQEHTKPVVEKAKHNFIIPDEVDEVRKPGRPAKTENI